MTADEFRDLLRSETAADIVDAHIVSSDPGPYTTREDLNLIDDRIRSMFRLKAEHSISTIVVGSAKLGFAYLAKEGQDGADDRPAYRPYVVGQSDLDVAVVSSTLFNLLWRELARYGAQQSQFPWRTELSRYILHGWIRPDKFPKATLQRCTDWWRVVDELNRSQQFRTKHLSCGIFESLYFLRLYQQRGVRTAQEAEMNE